MCAAGEKTQEKGSESPLREGVLKVDPKEHISVCQMNQQQGVAARCPTAPPAHVSSASPRWWNSKNSYNRCADCGTSSLCIQANPINQPPKRTLDASNSINIRSFPSSAAVESQEEKTVFSVLTALCLSRHFYINYVLK